MEIGLKQIKNSIYILIFSFLFLSGCKTNIVAESQIELPEKNWNYAKQIKTESKFDSLERYNIYFNLRVTAEYRYSNMYILFTIKDVLGKKTIRRYGYKLAANNGQWLGKGSGNLYSYKLPLLTNYKFPLGSIYTLVIEQNMRDNPLHGVNDAGIVVEKLTSINADDL